MLTGRHDFRRLFVIQILAATVALMAFLPFESMYIRPGPRLMAALLVTAVLATHLAFYVQNRVQRHTSASRAAIVFAMEPVFAALVTAAMAAGRFDLTAIQAAGGALIVAGLIMAGLGSRVSPPDSP